jgi:cytochrome c biogenesis protein CcdA/thiol-disulfide isomerase/thioredoxin
VLLLALTYLAGVLTILSPCILPVLPFVFSRAQKSFIKSGVPLLLGMCVTFSLLSAAALISGEWIGRASEVGRTVAMILMAAFGLSLLFPEISEKLFQPLTRVGSRLGQGASADGIWGSFVIGVSTGLLWAPCAGPILGLVLTGAATQGQLSRSVGLLLAYSLGAATSLALALVAGNRFLGALKKSLGADRVIKRFLGAAVLLGVAMIALNLDRTILTRLSKLETGSLESRLLKWAGLEQGAAEKIDTPLPDLSTLTSWINSKPLLSSDLAGKVVLLDIWTYSCINCLRTLPYVKAWDEKYRSSGLVVIGVHTPEFGFERGLENVTKAVQELGIQYPVVLDNDFRVWKALDNHYWPAHFFFDRRGFLRHRHFGEGEYDQSEQTIRELLQENSNLVLDQETVRVAVKGVQAPAMNDVESPETYIGYGRAKGLVATPEVSRDEIESYHSDSKLELNQWSIVGKWRIERERAVSSSKRAMIRFRFKARDLHLVLGGGGRSIRYKVKLDGQSPGADHGVDIDAEGHGVIKEHRLYQLIRQQGSAERLFEIEFEEGDVEAYAFTFG